MPEEVAGVFRSYPTAVATMLADVRQLIFAVAKSTVGVGPLVESLRWGEPAYLTAQSKSGSTLRLGRPATPPDRCAIYLNCRTTLVANFRTLFPNELFYQGDRAILLDTRRCLPDEQLSVCIAMALTYHSTKQRSLFV